MSRAANSCVRAIDKRPVHGSIRARTRARALTRQIRATTVMRARPTRCCDDRPAGCAHATRTTARDVRRDRRDPVDVRRADLRDVGPCPRSRRAGRSLTGVAGGMGATLEGDFLVTAAESLSIVVGGLGANGVHGAGGYAQRGGTVAAAASWSTARRSLSRDRGRRRRRIGAARRTRCRHRRPALAPAG